DDARRTAGHLQPVLRAARAVRPLTPPMSEPDERPEDPPHDRSGAVAPVDFRGAVLDGIGGWRGMVDSSIPVAVFAIVNIATALRTAVYAAVGAGVAVAVLRLARRQSVQQAVSGLFGLAI